VLTISDGVCAGTREDASGALLKERLEQAGHEVVWAGAVPDSEHRIAAELRRLAAEDVELVLTTGGTGFAPRDVTPEATAQVLERLSPGIDEALRADSLKHTAHGMLSRGISGIVRQTVIVNLPGSPKACAEGWAVLEPVLPHAVRLLRAEPTSHEAPPQ
jgi:molybdenum cofactor synthesis domain-containing protein